MRFKVEDLKKAIDWISSHSLDIHVIIKENTDHAIIQCADKYGQLVSIKLHDEGRMSVKIIKEETL